LAPCAALLYRQLQKKQGPATFGQPPFGRTLVHNRTAIRMGTGSRLLVTAALLAVLAVLLAGFWNMMRGTSPNLSQTLMRWRVGLQFLAIMLMLALVYLVRG
jgi:hypothetical protein